MKKGTTNIWLRVKSKLLAYGKLNGGCEVGTDAVRLFVAQYVGLPYTPEESTRLPGPVVALLKDRLSPADLEAMKQILVNLFDLKVVSNIVQDVGEHSFDEEQVVKGKTNFTDLLEWGLTQKEIEDILKMSMETGSSTGRDFLIQKNL